MQYKIGDKVKVRSDLERERRYGGDTFVTEMLPWRGAEVMITDIDDGEYLIAEDGQKWSWTDEMFEGGGHQ